MSQLQRCDKCQLVFNTDDPLDIERHDWLCFLSCKVQNWTFQRPTDSWMIHFFVLSNPLASVLTLANIFLCKTFGWMTLFFPYDRYIDFGLNKDFFPDGTDFPLPRIFGGAYSGEFAFDALNRARREEQDRLLIGQGIRPLPTWEKKPKEKVARGPAKKKVAIRKSQAEFEKQFTPYQTPIPKPQPRKSRSRALYFPKVRIPLKYEDCLGHFALDRTEREEAIRCCLPTMDETERELLRPVVSLWAFQNSVYFNGS